MLKSDSESVPGSAIIFVTDSGRSGRQTASRRRFESCLSHQKSFAPFLRVGARHLVLVAHWMSGRLFGGWE